MRPITKLGNLAVSALICISAMQASAKPVVGQQAPNFSLTGHDGQVYRLEDFKNKYVVLEWFNDDCPYVDKHYNEEYSNMQNLQKKWMDKAKANKTELVWFAVGSSAPGKQGYLDKASATKIGADRKANVTAFLLDGDGTVGQAYEAKTTPHMYIIDPTGKLRYMGAIDSVRSARVADIKKEGNVNYVDEALTALFAGKEPAKTETAPYGCSVKYAE